MKAKEILGKLTLEEKASLCSGKDFWQTEAIEKAGLESIMMTDGPHGLRKQVESEAGIGQSVKSTCFPSGVTLASSWDRELLEEVGETIAKEAKGEGVSIVLGPGANIKRSPLCGRNFEYFSEDPYLSSQIAKHHILGVQSQEVGACIKHFVANNQETRRFTVDTIVDKRSLYEIYLSSFETAIKEAKPWTVMCGYNVLNGEFLSNHKEMLTDVLRKEWGYEGVVISDWGAVVDRVKGVKAGLDIEMPGNGGMYDREIVKAVKNGELDEADLDIVAERMINLIIKGNEKKDNDATYDLKLNGKVARKAAEESIILLKNDDSILPLEPQTKIAVIGEFAEKPRYQGGGSSHINPMYLSNALDELKNQNISFEYAKGFEADSTETDNNLLAEAKEIAEKSEKVIIFAGLSDKIESEGFDRQDMKFPANQTELINQIAKINPNVVVVLANGSPVEMPWVNNAKGILETYLTGQSGGEAIVNILFGKVNPSGKLAETFPVYLEHNPSHLNFPGEGDKVEYKEGIFVGYRYYDTKKIDPLFPFGHGLSYTNFEYSDIKVDKKEINDTEEITVSLKIKNTGSVKGKEVVQFYVKDIDASVIRPEKELKDFVKVELGAGEEKEVSVTLSKRAFAYYNTEINDWHVESGEFEILVGSSSRDIRESVVINVTSTVEIEKKYSTITTFEDLLKHPNGKIILDNVIKGFMDSFSDGEEGSEEVLESFIGQMLKYMSLRTMSALSAGKLDLNTINELIKEFNK